jgi:DNA-binding NarL/FixJ family response regulator
MPTRTLRALFVNGTDEDRWLAQLRSVIAGLGVLDVVRKPDAFEQIRQYRYDLVVVDEGQLCESYEFISQILQVSPGTRVIVVSTLPEWRRARLAFLAGASDYLVSSISDEALLAALKGA